jgi:hypothetical protein
MRQRHLLVLVCTALAACGGGDVSAPGPLPEGSIGCGSEALYAAAHRSCEPMQAKAVPDPEHGSCFCFLGYAFNGSDCLALTDCYCAGEDCGKLTRTKEECEALHASCFSSPDSVSKPFRSRATTSPPHSPAL